MKVTLSNGTLFAYDKASVKFIVNGDSGTVKDNGALDKDTTTGVNGKIVVWVPAAGTYKWCEKTPPPRYLMTLPQCGVVDLVWDFGLTVDVMA